MNFTKKSIGLVILKALYLFVKVDGQTPGCGGTYYDSSGAISSPNYPLSYINNLNCSYYIVINPTNSVNIRFISFAAESCCDWLKVVCFIGTSTTNWTYTGLSLPPLLSIPSCSRVTLQFFTDGSVVYQGFSLRYVIGNGLIGGLTMKPINYYVINNSAENIVLSCASRAVQTDEYPLWAYSSDGITFQGITASNCSVFTSLYYWNSARQYSTRTCNLTISQLYLPSVTGVYTCTDSTLDFAGAQITVFSPSFTTVADLSSPTTEVVRDDQFTMTCSIRMNQSTLLPLQVMPSLYLYENQRPFLSSNTSISVIVAASSELFPSYLCYISFMLSRNVSAGYATNMPQQIYLMTPSLQVLYWPLNENMLIVGDDNGKVNVNGSLTCFVPANPPATYQWTNQDPGYQWTGATVHVSHNGTYTCTATNVIRGITHEALKSIDITVIASLPNVIYIEKNGSADQHIGNNGSAGQLNVVALIVGVVLGSVVLLLLVIVVVAFVCLCRKKHSGKADSNSQNIVAEATSDENSQNNIYEMTNRATLYANQLEAGISCEDNSAYDNNEDKPNVYETLRIVKKKP